MAEEKTVGELLTEVSEKITEFNGRLDNTLTRLDSNVQTAMNQSYPLFDKRILQTSLEKSYDDILAWDNAKGSSAIGLATLSAVGLKVNLKHGEAMLNNGNLMFYHNGENYLVADDEIEIEEITYSGLKSAANNADEEETAIVWYFDGGDGLNLGNEVNFNIVEFYYIRKSANNQIHVSYIDFTPYITIDSNADARNDFLGAIINLNAKEIYYKNQTDFRFFQNGKNTKKIISDVDFISTRPSPYFSFGGNNTSFYFPFLTGNNDIVIFNAMSGASFYFEALTGLMGFNGGNGTFGQNQNFNVVFFPKTLLTMSNTIFYNNNVTTLYLDCVNVIHTGSYPWFYGESSTPTNLFIGEEWNSELDLSVVANKQSNDWAVDFVKNKLKDLSGEASKTTKIPAARFNYLNTTLCDVEDYTDKTWIQYASEAKNWTVTS